MDNGTKVALLLACIDRLDKPEDGEYRQKIVKQLYDVVLEVVAFDEENYQ